MKSNWMYGVWQNKLPRLRLSFLTGFLGKKKRKEKKNLVIIVENLKIEADLRKNLMSSVFYINYAEAHLELHLTISTYSQIYMSNSMEIKYF